MHIFFFAVFFFFADGVGGGAGEGEGLVGFLTFFWVGLVEKGGGFFSLLLRKMEYKRDRSV